MILENEEGYNKPNKSERKRNIPIPYSGLGKLPPSATDLEEAVLGALMLEKQINPSIFNSIKPEYFYKDNHQKIYSAIVSLRYNKKPVDILTVTAHLRAIGELEMIGGAYYITELTQRVASAANIEFHILIVHQMFLKRELIRIGMECTNNMYDDTLDPFDQIRSIIKQITDLERDIFKQTAKSSAELMHEAIQEMNRPKPEGLLGLSTGMKGLDFITQGDQPGQLRIIAARPGMGKTAHMCSEMLSSSFCKDEHGNIVKRETPDPVACFSLEMKAVQLTFRMIANITEIDTLKIKKNQLTDQESDRFYEFADMYSQAPIFIDDTPGLTIDEFEVKAAMLVIVHGVRKIYIDYLQLMKGEKAKNYKGNRDGEIGDITRRLKTCANELGIPIIALSQLNRDVEKRPNCKPQISDLRESGSIEQDADVVMFLWRPEYYPEVIKNLMSSPDGGIFLKRFGLRINDYEGLIICIVAKCREEEPGDIPLKCKLSIMRISDHSAMLDYIQPSQGDLFRVSREVIKDVF